MFHIESFHIDKREENIKQDVKKSRKINQVLKKLHNLIFSQIFQLYNFELWRYSISARVILCFPSLFCNSLQYKMSRLYNNLFAVCVIAYAKA